MKLSVEFTRDGLIQVSAGADRYPPSVAASFHVEPGPDGRMVPIMDLSIPLGEFGTTQKAANPLRTLDDIDEE